jgi:uncharacterized membrane protein YeaQ/YmgE (transglycosylase-associated protein family)
MKEAKITVALSSSGPLVLLLRRQKEGEKPMSFLAWIVLGLIAGWIASLIVNKSGEGVLLDIVLGVVGAVLGGWLFNEFGHAGVTGLNLYSLLVSVVGAVVVLFLYHLLVRSSNTTTVTRP